MYATKKHVSFGDKLSKKIEFTINLYLLNNIVKNKGVKIIY